jgi:hypothetical protein
VIHAVLWDDPEDEDGNVVHIAGHSITTTEVEMVVFDNSSRSYRVRRPGAEERRMILGRTDSGRYLTVIVDLYPRNTS